MKKNLRALDFIYVDCEKVLNGRIDSLSALKNKIIYTAGGTGFVGTWVATLVHYLNEYHDFNTQVFLLARRPNVLNQVAPHLVNNRHITLIENDIRRIFELPSETNYVLHAACNPDNRFHALNPMETMSIISEGTKNLLMAAERCSHLENFLYLSSASIYGSQPADLNNIKEDFLGAAPRTNTSLSAYAESKRFAETLCTVFRSQFRLPIVIARPFAFVGPYQLLDKPWAINNFINDVLQGEAIKVFGDGKTVRTYLYGSDAAFWLLTLLARGSSSDIYNVGSDEVIDINSLANLVAELAPSKPEIVFSNIPTHLNQSSKLVPSTELAKTKLSLAVTVKLREAIEKTLHWNELCLK